MAWYDDQPVMTPPAAPQPAPSLPPARGLRRGAIVAALGALLLVGGGVAAVSAASPEPSTAPSVVEPDATTQPDDGTRNGHDCPNEDGSGGTDGGSNSSDDSNSDASASDA
jgi:hypothetical protein